MPQQAVPNVEITVTKQKQLIKGELTSNYIFLHFVLMGLESIL